MSVQPFTSFYILVSFPVNFLGSDQGAPAVKFSLMLERSIAIENKSARGEPVEPLERLELAAV